eukprot:3788123-Rhodomonas_salina.2
MPDCAMLCLRRGIRYKCDKCAVLTWSVVAYGAANVRYAVSDIDYNQGCAALVPKAVLCRGVWVCGPGIHGVERSFLH